MQRKKEHDVHNKEIEPDNELLLWEKWINIRKEETAKLSLKLDKPPVDLTMNLLEKVRENKEWKITLEHAQIRKKPTVRGHLWEQPLRLAQKCYMDPVYEVHRTPAEMGKPGIIEHVCVPNYIKENEKGLNGIPQRVVCQKLDSDFVKYKKKRETILKEKIKKIDPFKPSCSGLIVKGCKPTLPPPKLPPLPSIVSTPVSTEYESVLSTVYAVRINNTVVYKHVPGQTLAYLDNMVRSMWHENCTSWSYYFNTPVKRAGRCKLFLQNLGTVSLRYCWKKIKRSIPFIPEEPYEQVFFFNKNEDVLSPGQKREMFLTFLSNKAGIYSEIWEINFSNICFFDTMSDKLTVNLFADSVENTKCNLRKCEILKSRIVRKAIVNVVTEILNDIVTEAVTVKPQYYPYKKLFLEAEIFVMKNPVCFYHQTEVGKIKELYTEMLPGEPWDLSINTWRRVMMEKNYEERMVYYDLLKKSYSEFLKPWYEGEDLLSKKYRAMKLLLGVMADKFDKKYAQLIGLYSSIYSEGESSQNSSRRESLNPLLYHEIRNVFYIHAYEYVATTMEMCAGILSSLDLNRWIEFNFCRQ